MDPGSSSSWPPASAPTHSTRRMTALGSRRAPREYLRVGVIDARLRLGCFHSLAALAAQLPEMRMCFVPSKKTRRCAAFCPPTPRKWELKHAVARLMFKSHDALMPCVTDKALSAGGCPSKLQGGLGTTRQGSPSTVYEVHVLVFEECQTPDQSTGPKSCKQLLTWEREKQNKNRG
jgi:hypothetical protein